MTTELFFEDLPKGFLDEVRRRFVRMNQPRAGGIFPRDFEHGMVYVYAQILQDLTTENKLVEAYTKLRKSSFDNSYIYQELNNYFHDLNLKENKGCVVGRGGEAKET